MTAILISFAIALAVNGAFFAFAAARRTDVVTDLSYSLTFALLAVVLLFGAPPSRCRSSPRCSSSSGRRGSAIYLFRRIMRTKVDHRFDGMRDQPLRFARFWLLQAITVAVVMLPVSYLLDQDDPPGLGAWSIAGGAVWLAGLLIEAVADAQKAAFRAKEENRGRFVASGLWRYSRHPNYFGEMLVWWGLFLYVVPVLQRSGVRGRHRPGLHHAAPAVRERDPAAREERQREVRGRRGVSRLQTSDEHPRPVPPRN